jgi:nucleotide-binding universal stress UspA family protein
VDVVVVPELWQPSDGFVNRVVLAVGDWHGANGLFEHAFDVADQHHASLRVLHAWDLPSVYQDSLLDAMAVENWRHAVVIELENAFAETRRRHPGVKVTVDVVHGRPGDTLLDASREADLLVLGRRDVAHPAVQHLGSLPRAVFRVSECPVDVVPRPFD